MPSARKRAKKRARQRAPQDANECERTALLDDSPRVSHALFVPACGHANNMARLVSVIYDATLTNVGRAKPGLTNSVPTVVANAGGLRCAIPALTMSAFVLNVVP